ncbi:MAG: response regulator transcription factor [Gammaproteobacteria bacterium]|nr:response regulator transcription factor [Gammaproteobacteria bacterium]
MDIFVVDDHQLFLDGFCLLLDKLNADTRITSCNNSQEGMKILSKNNNYDLIILDLSIPDIDGITLLKDIREKNILSPVVFVSASENINQIARAVLAGASGFIPKHSDTTVMIDALSEILSGNFYLPAALTPLIEKELDYLYKQADSVTALTKRQQQVLQSLSKGLSNKEIADLLSISEPTVKSHISIIFQTLNVKNRVECVREAEKVGII